ncbi:MAG TPA: FAD:protein FMN transferase [Gemmatimonadales bacterium]|nr:FAD:protein FMN transferase [Gemmatimonadales bacterium]
MRPILGTFVAIRATGPRALLEHSIKSAFTAVERVHRLMSFHDAASDVARINAAPAGSVVTVDRETYAVLRAAHALGAASRGVFDIASAPVLVESGFLPDCGTTTPRPATYCDLELLPRAQVRWRAKGWIDLGGIAKGYAVDRAVAELRAHGVASGVVNAGGDLRCFGRPHAVRVRAPRDPGTLLSLGSLWNGAVATSAGYFSRRVVAGRQVDALVDPHRAACVRWGRSISVVAADCMTADALTKIVRLAPERCPGLLERLGAQAIVIGRSRVGVCGRSWLEPPLTA